MTDSDMTVHPVSDLEAGRFSGDVDADGAHLDQDVIGQQRLEDDVQAPNIGLLLRLLAHIGAHLLAEILQFLVDDLTVRQPIFHRLLT